MGYLGLSVVGRFVFLGWDVVEAAVQSAVVEPVDPFHRCVLDVVDDAQRARQERAATTDGFGLEQAESWSRVSANALS
jgi:hypothetical protein